MLADPPAADLARAGLRLAADDPAVERAIQAVANGGRPEPDGVKGRPYKRPVKPPPACAWWIPRPKADRSCIDSSLRSYPHAWAGGPTTTCTPSSWSFFMT